MTTLRIAMALLVMSTTVALAQTDNKKKMDDSKKKIENITQYGVVRPSTGTASGYSGQYNYPAKKPSIDRTFVPSPNKPFDQTPHQKLTNPLNAQPKVQQKTTTAAPVVQRSTTTTTTTTAAAPAKKK
ncbi:MAG: hypothetical protein HY543_08825 [Deltaproteobacteria bacterium]|nr:hypothetical protein [Deltaproteobacteria bacterium]